MLNVLHVRNHTECPPVADQLLRFCIHSAPHLVDVVRTCRIFNHIKTESCRAAAELSSGSSVPPYIAPPVILGVFALGSLLVFRRAHTLVSVCVFCLWPVNITEG